MFPFAKLFIEIIDNSQTKRVRDLKILPDLEQGLKTKISIFAKGNILRCSLLQNDQCWAPQIQTVFRNRKFRKIAMGGPQPQIRKFAVRLR